MPHSDSGPSSPPSSFPDLPPFSSSVPTAPLLRISLAKLLSHDEAEEQRCWTACQQLGFFYLDLRDAEDGNVNGDALLKDADSLFDAMKSFFELEVEEKVKYDLKDQGSYFGYKGYGEGFVDAKGNRDRNEFYNISKDDILSLTEPLPAPPILDPHRPLFESYIRSSHGICTILLSLLSNNLPLSRPARSNGGLSTLHRLDAISGDQVRFVHAPPQSKSHLDPGVALGAHTDFGSVTILFNRLGGLQVQLPSSISAVKPASSSPPMSDTETKLCQDNWAYVRPLPGHAIVNLGDALVKFSGARVRSNIHRVVPAPGEQGTLTRWSLVYFCRPEDDIVLENLMGDGKAEGGEVEEKVTAKEWILRRALGKRKVDGWEDANGTEGVEFKGGRDGE